ncbi:hypothetical protein HELRODRAFT_70349 [Helobdella robusta]|uniref:Complexin n=1 Tax=Helobdella robusta TaxID=6412 RepID=T1G053_HELRO|nr:hypothetical protein HELRODRAFT_70349 [Helobdella robusta]ESN91399.1 hypothetical protein HELRODRAFT_70349 [Helobdella robusta]
MTAFLAKQMLGNQLESVKGALGDKEKEEKKSDDEEDPEILEAKREEEEKRKEKYRKIEEEREKMRQDIRTKYNIKKKETNEPAGNDPSLEGRLGRKKKNPEDPDADGTADVSEYENGFPKTLNELTARVSQLPGRIMASVSEASDRCSLQ